MTSSDIAHRDCVEVRVVSVGSQMRLFAPMLAKVAAILVVGSAVILFRASRRGWVTEASLMAVVLVPLLPLLVWHARRRLRQARAIAAFMLTRRERRVLGIPTPDSSVAQREVGKFKLVCWNSRPRLMEGSTTHEVTELGLVVAVLVSRRASVVGVELRRGQHVVTKYAFGC